MDLKEGWHDECGVFGVYSPGADVAKMTYFGLFALQHRGQESAGIAVADGRSILLHKDMGLVTQVFKEDVLNGMKGCMAIGHVRYATVGSSKLANAQPLMIDRPGGQLVLGHNGSIINASILRAEMEAAGTNFETTIDSEVIGKILADMPELALEEAVPAMMSKIIGAYSLVMMTEKALIGVRDPYGVRPLCLGRINGTGYVLASESCALHVVGATFEREIDPGEIVFIDESGLRSYKVGSPSQASMCIFEFVYVARPDSHINGQSLHLARRRMGQLLAREHFAEADMVIPVPDSGTPAAIGYAEASRIPFGEGLIKNRYIGRTFIQPDQRLRDLGIKMKLTPLHEALVGKRIVLVDDSIVRGSTSGKIVRMLKEAGAIEVHVRVSSPPIKYPCFYGIDTAVRKDLIASSKEVEEIRQEIGADSLAYLSMSGMVAAIGCARHEFCMACFNGKYPVPVPERIRRSKFIRKGQEKDNEEKRL
jgi:amidophosphoribosyltransferase